MAIGVNQHGTMAGKLNGLTTATTPSGWRIEYESTLDETDSEKPPFIRCGIPQANSTTSSARRTSPSASESTLPCSEVTTAASSDSHAWSSSRKANRTVERWLSEAWRQAANASDRRSDRRVHLGRGREVDIPREPAGRRVEHLSRGAPTFPAGDAPPTQWGTVGQGEGGTLDVGGPVSRRGRRLCTRHERILPDGRPVRHRHAAGVLCGDQG